MTKYEQYIFSIQLKKQIKIQQKIKEFSGKWLNETNRISSHYICELMCSKKHIFTLHNASLIRGFTWCPICDSKSPKGEKICQLILEKLLNTKFIKTRRIDGLVNSKGIPLEIDGFSNELKIGFEYQGKQHYIFSPYIHNNIKNFKNLKKRDNLKLMFF